MSFNEPFKTNNPTPFPIEAPVVTAFWTTPPEEESVLVTAESRKYLIIDDSDSNGVDVINHIKEYLIGKNIELNVNLVVIARWNSSISKVHWWYELIVCIITLLYILEHIILCYHSNRWCQFICHSFQSLWRVNELV